VVPVFQTEYGAPSIWGLACSTSCRVLLKGILPLVSCVGEKRVCDAIPRRIADSRAHAPTKISAQHVRSSPPPGSPAPASAASGRVRADVGDEVEPSGFEGREIARRQALDLVGARPEVGVLLPRPRASLAAFPEWFPSGPALGSTEVDGSPIWSASCYTKGRPRLSSSLSVTITLQGAPILTRKGAIAKPRGDSRSTTLASSSNATAVK
jgi:hypothetical protein